VIQMTEFNFNTVDLNKKALDILQKNGKESRRIKQLLNNNCVFVTHDDLLPLMIKFVPLNEREKLEVEIAMFDFLKAKTSLEVPRVLSYGENDALFYLLREMIKGETLGAFLEKHRNTKDGNIGEIFFEAGVTLGTLHSIALNEKGIFNPDLSIQPYDLFSKKEYTGFIDSLLDKGVISKPEHRSLSKIDVDYYYSGKPNVLCHCDYNPNNILVREKRVVGVIDYEWVSSAPYMDDLATFDLFSELLGCHDKIPCFYRGYQSIKTIDDFYFNGKDFYKFYRLLTMLSYQSSAANGRFHGDFFQKMQHKLRRTRLNANNFVKE
jgi:Ser/Thr protein kinase RdoA (MazF antagonist)